MKKLDNTILIFTILVFGCMVSELSTSSGEAYTRQGLPVMIEDIILVDDFGNSLETLHDSKINVQLRVSNQGNDKMDVTIKVELAKEDHLELVDINWRKIDIESGENKIITIPLNTNGNGNYMVTAKTVYDIYEENFVREKSLSFFQENSANRMQVEKTYIGQIDVFDEKKIPASVLQKNQIAFIVPQIMSEKEKGSETFIELQGIFTDSSGNTEKVSVHGSLYGHSVSQIPLIWFPKHHGLYNVSLTLFDSETKQLSFTRELQVHVENGNGNKKSHDMFLLNPRIYKLGGYFPGETPIVIEARKTFFISTDIVNNSDSPKTVFFNIEVYDHKNELVAFQSNVPEMDENSWIRNHHSFKLLNPGKYVAKIMLDENLYQPGTFAEPVSIEFEVVGNSVPTNNQMTEIDGVRMLSLYKNQISDIYNNERIFFEADIKNIKSDESSTIFRIDLYKDDKLMFRSFSEFIPSEDTTPETFWQPKESGQYVAKAYLLKKIDQWNVIRESEYFEFELDVKDGKRADDFVPTNKSADIVIPSDALRESCEKDVCFTPTIFHAKTGQKVTWFNADYLFHYVRSFEEQKDEFGIHKVPHGIINSGRLDSGTEYSLVFEEVGKYDYFCMIHPWMQGIIVVKDSKDTTFKTDSEPMWFKETRRWFEQGLVSKNELETALDYLKVKGIMN